MDGEYQMVPTKRPPTVNEIIAKNVDYIVNRWDTLQLAESGNERIPYYRRIQKWWYRRKGLLNVRIIRANDFLTMDKDTFERYRYCIVGQFWRGLGINWKKFVTIHSEKNGSLVIEWV
jgi:hypothetical protein